MPYEYSVLANDKYPNSSLFTIEGGMHGFVGDDDVACVKAQLDFFKSSDNQRENNQ